jgi:hypothetical protein
MAGAQPAPTQPSATGPGEVVPDAMIPRAVLLMQQGRLLPQAWLYGLLYTHETALSRSSFLLDELNVTGSWRYFPLAMAFKSPLALLAAAAGALAIAAAALAKRGAGAPGGTAARFEERWAAICLMVPAGVYLLVALGANINIGLRHVLPVYPFVYIGIGLAAARAWRGSRGVAMVLGVVLGLGLVAETALAHPNYLAFFNALAGGPRGGLRLLGDSNLDWGQDLKLLAEWKQRHPDVELYLSYFGSVDPTQFGVDQHPTLLAARWGGAAEQLRTGPGRVLAVSATNLQTIYAQNESQRQILQLIRDTFRPMEVLGGTIYLYDLNTMAAYAVFGPPSPPSAPAATAPATQTRPEAGGRSR